MYYVHLLSLDIHVYVCLMMFYVICKVYVLLYMSINIYIIHLNGVNVASCMSVVTVVIVFCRRVWLLRVNSCYFAVPAYSAPLAAF